MTLIILPHGQIKKLALDFSKSLPTVRKALRGESRSEISDRIRKAALERGGKLFMELDEQVPKK